MEKGDAATATAEEERGGGPPGRADGLDGLIWEQRTEHKAEVRCTKPVRSAWSKGHPLSKRDWTASKLGPWSIPWKNTPE